MVKVLSTVFENDLKGSSYNLEAILNSSNAQKLTISPFSLAPLVQFINSAKKTIQIQNQYLKDPTMNAAIMKAAKRGVNVYVMVSSACSFGRPKPSMVTQWNAQFGEFDQAGIHTKIFTRNILVSGVHGYLHAKAILVDSNRAWVGSVNGSTMSLSNNREFGIFLDDPTEVNKLSTFLYSDFTNPNAESWQDSLLCKHDPRPTPQGEDSGAEDPLTVSGE